MKKSEVKNLVSLSL